MPTKRNDPGKNWPSNNGLAAAHTRCVELVGSVAMVRETRAFAGGVKLCEAGYADMCSPMRNNLRQLVVLGASWSWPRALAALELAVADPAIRAEIERHDELLAALVAQRRAEQAEEAALEGHGEDA